MAIIFVQRQANAVYVIDYIEDNHQTYAWYVNAIKAKAYNLGKCWLPHDSKKHTAQTGKTDKEILEALGMDCQLVPDIGVQRGIEAARQMFHRVYFDKDKTTPLFNRLRRYARVISPMTEQPGLPKKDGNDHGADAFRYLAVIESKLTNETNEFRKIKYSNQGIV